MKMPGQLGADAGEAERRRGDQDHAVDQGEPANRRRNHEAHPSAQGGSDRPVPID